MDDEQIDVGDVVEDLPGFLDMSTSDSDEENITDVNKICQNIVQKKVHEISQAQTKNKLSYEGFRDVVKLMNSMPGSSIKLPEDIKILQRVASETTNSQPIFLVFCEKCDELVRNGEECTGCHLVAKKISKKSNFLVHFPLVPQICRILKMHSGVIMKHLHRARNDNVISHVDDGQLFENLLRKYGNELLTFTLNSDGANIFASSRWSLWPVQLYLNCLPPSIRLMPENIIVTTLYYGGHKPDMSTLLFPLCKELECLDEESISVYTSENNITAFKTSILLFAADLPARAEIQNFIGHNGKYGFLFCYHPGVPIKNLSRKSTTIRFIHQNEIKLRTHGETVMLMQRACNECGSKTKSIEGVKGPSSVLMLPDLDVIKSFSIDYMHGVGLGVMNHLIEIWIGKKAIPKPPYSDYMIKKTLHRQFLNKRIVCLKPPQSVRRLPRSLDEVANFKATELIHHMWFYLRYTLPGLLPTKLIKHFEKLSAAT